MLGELVEMVVEVEPGKAITPGKPMTMSPMLLDSKNNSNRYRNTRLICTVHWPTSKPNSWCGSAPTILIFVNMVIEILPAVGRGEPDGSGINRNHETSRSNSSLVRCGSNSINAAVIRYFLDISTHSRASSTLSKFKDAHETPATAIAAKIWIKPLFILDPICKRYSGYTKHKGTVLRNVPKIAFSEPMVI